MFVVLEYSLTLPSLSEHFTFPQSNETLYSVIKSLRWNMYSFSLSQTINFQERNTIEIIVDIKNTDILYEKIYI